jgi:hypothetical protein|tara:strand:- start:3681 stop:3821 length:141 start_codon:yes stop_codon:yes gene_type:complete
MEYRFFTVNNKGVTRVMPTLEPDHRFAAVSQQINDLAFSLVSPLDA